MNTGNNILRTISLLLMMSSFVHPQESYEKVNSHFGALVSFPQSPTSRYVHAGGGVVGGVGYNFSSHHAIIGEFMWNRLGATDWALQPLRQAIQSRGIGGKSTLYVATGNYRYEWRGKVVGMYFIGGGGLYYRTTNPSKRIDAGSGTPCTQTWMWWGFSCTSGTVTPNQSLASVGSNAFGGNGGIGLTVRVGEEPYRIYVESRYHYAPNQTVNTKVITVIVGVHY